MCGKKLPFQLIVLVTLMLLSFPFKGHSFPEFREDFLESDAVIDPEISFTQLIEEKLALREETNRTGQVLTVEVLAVADHTLAGTLDTEAELYEFINVNFNAASRYFRSFKDPEIRVKVTGVHVLWSEKEETFFLYGKKYALEPGVLGRLRLWDNHYKDVLPKHDLVYLLIGYYARGRAYLRNICYSSIPSIWTDGRVNPYIPGLLTHEIGHILGSNDYYNGPVYNVYIMGMGIYEYGPASYQFDTPSREEIEEFTQKRVGDCVFKDDATQEQLDCFNFDYTKMPGDFLTLNETCVYAHGEGSYILLEESNCEKMKCRDPSGKTRNHKGLDGTKELCTDGKRCFEAECKAE